MILLDIILVEPQIIPRVGFTITPYHYLIHTIVETIATILVEGFIFWLLCKEVSLKKVAIANAITCIGLHIVYYILARTYFIDKLIPAKATFENLAHALLTGHILLITILEVIVCLIEYFFYERNSNKKLKIFLVTILANVVAFFIGIAISVSVVLLLIK